MVQNLNLLQKKKIIEERERLLRPDENASQRALVKWAQAKLRLPHDPGKAVMSRIFSKAESLPNQPTRALSKKKRNKKCKKMAKRQGRCPRVDPQGLDPAKDPGLIACLQTRR